MFSGFDPRVSENARRYLQASQVLVVQGGSKASGRNYFQDSLLAARYNIRQIENEDVRLNFILVSCIEDSAMRDLEQEAFFPALRRLQVPAAWRGDIHGGRRIADAVIASFNSARTQELQAITKWSAAAVALLPCENIRPQRLRRELEGMYHMNVGSFSRRLNRDVLRMKRGKGIRVGNLEFKGCLNDPSHPVRRTSDQAQCDVGAALRLGFGVPIRFEFDVSCAQGLAGLRFRHCDGVTEQIQRDASHVNMRINGDFQPGSK